MQELIDKQATLKKMCETCGYCERFEMAMRSTHPDFVTDKCNSYKFLAEQPTIEAEPVNRWIPVKDALPELDTMVIVCYYGSDCIFPMQGETVTEAVARQNKVPTVTMGFLDEEGWNGADMFPMMVQPTFWMNLPDAPLPEPPKE